MVSEYSSAADRQKKLLKDTVKMVTIYQVPDLIFYDYLFYKIKLFNAMYFE